MTNFSSDETAAARAVWRTAFAASVFTLTAIGVVMVYSASCARAAAFGADFYFLQRQLLWLALGAASYAVAAVIDWRRWQNWWVAGFVGVLFLLGAVLAPGIGSKVNGAYRWLRFGGFNMQPSEIAKFATIFALAAFLAKFPAKIPFWRGILPTLMIIAMPVGLVLLEPDLGTAALIGAAAFSLVIVAGAKIWQIFCTALFASPLAFLGWQHKKDYVLKRIEAWSSATSDGAGYQIHMSKVALGSGGVDGMGLGAGSAKLYFLPEAHTDFILAIIGQELGLIGTLGVAALFGLLLISGAKLLQYTSDRFSALLIYGVTITLSLQAVFNFAVVTAAIPPKGISLPFVSFGGSGLLVALMMCGAVMSVTRERREKNTIGKISVDGVNNASGEANTSPTKLSTAKAA